jgi:hypothetical protein
MLPLLGPFPMYTSWSRKGGSPVIELVAPVELTLSKYLTFHVLALIRVVRQICAQTDGSIHINSTLCVRWCKSPTRHQNRQSTISGFSQRHTKQPM